MRRNRERRLCGARRSGAVEHRSHRRRPRFIDWEDGDSRLICSDLAVTRRARSARNPTPHPPSDRARFSGPGATARGDWAGREALRVSRSLPRRRSESCGHPRRRYERVARGPGAAASRTYVETGHRVLQIHNHTGAGGEDVVAARSDLLRGCSHAVIEHHVTNPSGASPGAATRRRPLEPGERARCDAIRERPTCTPQHLVHIVAVRPRRIILSRRSVVMTLHNYRLFAARRCCSARVDRVATASAGHRGRSGTRYHDSTVSRRPTATIDQPGHWVKSADWFIAPTHTCATLVTE